MAASLDDFSLLVDLHGPSDLTRRPAYRSPLDATDSRLAEVLAPYDFAEPRYITVGKLDDRIGRTV